MSTVPDPKLIMEEINGTLPKGTASPLGMLAYNIIGLIVFMGFAWICWKRYETKEKMKLVKEKWIMKTWENYKVDSINRLPGRAHFSSFPSKETALLNENKYTQAYKNLNGRGIFFLEAPEYSPENFLRRTLIQAKWIKSLFLEIGKSKDMAKCITLIYGTIFPLIRRMYQRKTQQVFTNGHLL